MDLKTMLDAKAEEVRLGPHIPPSVLRRARRRRTGIAVLTGAVTVGLALGAFVGARALLDETASAPPEIRPGGGTEKFYPFIYPPTKEELDGLIADVEDGALPPSTHATAMLFGMNVMGWDEDDVHVDVVDSAGEEIAAVISNPAISHAAGSGRAIRTTLVMARIPGTSEPKTIYAVVAAQAEGLELEPIGPDEAFGANGRIGFRGSLGFIPEDAFVALTVNGGNPVFAPAPGGVFEVEAPAPEPLEPSTLISIAVLDGSRNTVALTSSRIATPIDGETASGASEPQLAIPPGVAATRRAILDAAQARDFEALRALIPEEGFTFSFGGDTDPIRYWKRLESEGHVPVIGDVLPGVLGSEPAFDRGTFVWPAQATQEPAEWDERDIDALSRIHSEEDIRAFQEAGLYLGWRVGIDRRGTWLFFVAGD